MLKQELFVILLLVVIATQLQAARQTQRSIEKPSDNSRQNLQTQTNETNTRTGRIMRILKEPAPPVKQHNHAPQSRRDRYPPNQQRPLPIIHHRPFFGGTRNQMLRRVQNGPPPNIALRPQKTFNYESVKGTRFTQNSKDAIPPPNHGKGAVYRPQFFNGPHPNALTSQGHSPQYFQNFKPSPQYNGNAIVRPVPDFQQYTGHKTETLPYQEIKQFPLPQQPPQHQQQLIITNQRPNINTAPQTFPTIQQQQQQPPLNQHTEALLKSTENVANSPLQTYSVYEDPEISEHAPLQFNSQQNPLTYNLNILKQQKIPAFKEAEDYLRFMSTNEYFLPKFNPNYKKLDEEKDLRLYKQLKNKQQPQQQQQQQQNYQPLQQYGKMLPATDVADAATFQQPIQVSQLFNQEDPSPVSTIVRGSYQTGNNAFVVKSDGNKAIKHIVPTSLATHGTTSPSLIHFNSQRHRTPEPIRFEFTEKDAVPGAHTNSPPLNTHLHYQNIVNKPISSPTPASEIRHNRPIAVNEVDADPEDGDDMQEAGTDFYGRVPIRSSTEASQSDSDKLLTSTPSTQQTDTEEFCERMCANVQDEDAEIICGSDGYMYTGEAQMECYASCLHIDVTIQGKGSCSAR